MNGPANPWTKRILATISTVTVASAVVFTAALAADPAAARSDNSAGCAGATRGRVLATTSLEHLGSAQVANELRGAGLPGSVRYGVETYRLEYCTISTSGTPIAASGLLAIPATGAYGPLPTVLYDHSTATRRTDTPSFLTGTEDRVIPFFFSSAGYAVVAPDYLGLGTSPGQHPYLHAATEASSSLDMLRAAGSASQALARSLSRRVFVTGFSQGGQAAMATGEALQQADSSWRLAALAPMAGPYDLSGAESAAMLDPTRTNPQRAAVYAAYIFTAWKKLYNLYTDPHQIFTARYANVVEGLFDGTHSFPDIDAALPAAQDLFRPEILRLIAQPTGRYAAALRDNDVCHWAPNVPTRLYAAHGDQDVVIANADQCRRQIAARGGTAEIVDVGAVDHVGTAIASLPLVRAWFTELAQANGS